MKTKTDMHIEKVVTHPIFKKPGFQIETQGKKALLVLSPEKPEDIYSEKFASKISLLLRQGKRIFLSLGNLSKDGALIQDFQPVDFSQSSIKLGDLIPQRVRTVGDKLWFLVSEIVYGDVGKKILALDNNGNRLIQYKLVNLYSLNGFKNFIQKICFWKDRQLQTFLQLEEVTPIKPPQANYKNTEPNDKPQGGYFIPIKGEQETIVVSLADGRKVQKIIETIQITSGRVTDVEFTQIKIAAQQNKIIEIIPLNLLGQPYSEGFYIDNIRENDVCIYMNDRHFVEGNSEKERILLALNAVLKKFLQNKYKIGVDWGKEDPCIIEALLKEEPFTFNPNNYQVQLIGEGEQEITASFFFMQ